MKTASVFTMLLLGVALIGCGGGGGGGTGDGQPPSILDARVSPNLVVVGGTVNASATVSDNVGVSDVSLVLQGTSLRARLLPTEPGVYSGSLTLDISIPVGVYSAVIEARDTAGNVSQSTWLSVTIENPPPPP